MCVLPDEELEKKNKLTDREFWDKRHSDHANDEALTEKNEDLSPRLGKLKHRLGAQPNESYATFQYWKTITESLPRNQDWKVLEVGSAPGRNLVKFNRALGYQPYGVEYSRPGVEATKETFRKHGYDEGNVIEADFFDPDFQKTYREHFDIVGSGGFIEHFDDPALVVKSHVNLIKTGGYIMCSIPNMRGYSYPYLANFARDLLDAHNLSIMRKQPFERLFENQGLETLVCGYVGCFDMFGTSFRKEPTFRGKISRAVDLFNTAISELLFLLMRGKTFDTKWSPHLMYIGKKIK